MSNNVKVTIDNHILLIQLSNCSNENKLSTQIMCEITKILEDFRMNAKCKAVVFTGCNGMFCGGGDLGDWKSQTSKDILVFADALVQLHKIVAEYPKLVIGAIDGYVKGGGFSLMETFDLAVATPKSTFSIPEINGALAPMISILSMRNHVTRKTCMESIVFGGEIDAGRAKEMGLINQIVDTDDIVAVAIDYILPFLNKNLNAFEVCKRYYNLTHNQSYTRQLEQGKYLLTTMLKL